MSTSCMTYISARKVRVTKLDSCGRPIEGDASVVTTKGQASVGIATNSDEGSEISVPNSNGEILARVPAKPRFLGHTLTVTLAQVDPDLVTLLTGQEPALDYDGNSVGFTTDDAISIEDVAFAFELWLGAPTGDNCDDEGAEGSFGYVLFPFVQGGMLGDFTAENAAVSFVINNAATKTGNRWGRGSYPVVRDGAGDPALLPTALKPTQHMLVRSTSVAPPQEYCGARPFLPAGDAEITAMNAVVTGLSVEFTPDPAGSDPYWIEYGDGNWDYVPGGGPVTYVYEEAGVFTAVTRRGISVVETEVTVTES